MSSSDGVKGLTDTTISWNPTVIWTRKYPWLI